MISVIVPAHNEQSTIVQCLRLLTEEPKNLEVIVVCNGCSDNTVSLARTVNGPITVLETEVASKTNALNIGDKQATGYPRFYIDADLAFSTSDIKKIAGALGKGVLAAAPEFKFNYTNVSRLVILYYQMWHKMPYHDGGRIAGAYALSQEGRDRFQEFPEVTSDDSFVRLQFKPEERVTVKDCYVEVLVPRTLKHLILIKRRSHRGTYELKRKYPNLFKNETASTYGSLGRLLLFLNRPLAVCIYVYVSVAAKILAKIDIAQGRESWHRDESSRTMRTEESK